jgi:hypothetical protein
MRWKLVGTLLVAGLTFLAIFVILVVRAEWFFHVVARKDFLWPSDSRHPYHFAAEIRRVWPERDWRSLFYHDPGIYMRYECRIWDNETGEVITSTRWVFADHPHPSDYSISASNLDGDPSQVTFYLDGELVDCTFDENGHWHWDRPGSQAPAFKATIK